MSPDTLTLSLTPDQVEYLDLPVCGQGGFQILLALLQDRRRGRNQLTLTRSDCEKVVRYSKDYGQGGFQERLRSIVEEAEAYRGGRQ